MPFSGGWWNPAPRATYIGSIVWFLSGEKEPGSERRRGPRPVDIAAYLHGNYGFQPTWREAMEELCTLKIAKGAYKGSSWARPLIGYGVQVITEHVDIREWYTITRTKKLSAPPKQARKPWKQLSPTTQRTYLTDWIRVGALPSDATLADAAKLHARGEPSGSSTTSALRRAAIDPLRNLSVLLSHTDKEWSAVLSHQLIIETKAILKAFALDHNPIKGKSYRSDMTSISISK